jgi:hypothetical protein
MACDDARAARANGNADEYRAAVKAAQEFRRWALIAGRPARDPYCCLGCGDLLTRDGCRECAVEPAERMIP